MSSRPSNKQADYYKMQQARKAAAARKEKEEAGKRQTNDEAFGVMEESVVYGKNEGSGEKISREKALENDSKMKRQKVIQNERENSGGDNSAKDNESAATEPPKAAEADDRSASDAQSSPPTSPSGPGKKPPKAPTSRAVAAKRGEAAKKRQEEEDEPSGPPSTHPSIRLPPRQNSSSGATNTGNEQQQSSSRGNTPTKGPPSSGPKRRPSSQQSDPKTPDKEEHHQQQEEHKGDAEERGPKTSAATEGNPSEEQADSRQGSIDRELGPVQNEPKSDHTTQSDGSGRSTPRTPRKQNSLLDGMPVAKPLPKSGSFRTLSGEAQKRPPLSSSPSAKQNPSEAAGATTVGKDDPLSDNQPCSNQESGGGGGAADDRKTPLSRSSSRATSDWAPSVRESQPYKIVAAPNTHTTDAYFCGWIEKYPRSLQTKTGEIEEKHWKKRFFVLDRDSGQLKYFESQTDALKLGALGSAYTKKGTSRKMRDVFELVPPPQSTVKDVRLADIDQNPTPESSSEEGFNKADRYLIIQWLEEGTDPAATPVPSSFVLLRCSTFREHCYWADAISSIIDPVVEEEEEEEHNNEEHSPAAKSDSEDEMPLVPQLSTRFMHREDDEAAAATIADEKHRQREEDQLAQSKLVADSHGAVEVDHLPPASPRKLDQEEGEKLDSEEMRSRTEIETEEADARASVELLQEEESQTKEQEQNLMQQSSSIVNEEEPAGRRRVEAGEEESRSSSSKEEQSEHDKAVEREAVAIAVRDSRKNEEDRAATEEAEVKPRSTIVEEESDVRTAMQKLENDDSVLVAAKDQLKTKDEPLARSRVESDQRRATQQLLEARRKEREEIVEMEEKRKLEAEKQLTLVIQDESSERQSISSEEEKDRKDLADEHNSKREAEDSIKIIQARARKREALEDIKGRRSRSASPTGNTPRTSMAVAEEETKETEKEEEEEEAELIPQPSTLEELEPSPVEAPIPEEDPNDGPERFDTAEEFAAREEEEEKRNIVIEDINGNESDLRFELENTEEAERQRLLLDEMAEIDELEEAADQQQKQEQQERQQQEKEEDASAPLRAGEVWLPLAVQQELEDEEHWERNRILEEEYYGFKQIRIAFWKAQEEFTKSGGRSGEQQEPLLISPRNTSQGRAGRVTVLDAQPVTRTGLAATPPRSPERNNNKAVLVGGGGSLYGSQSPKSLSHLSPASTRASKRAPPTSRHFSPSAANPLASMRLVNEGDETTESSQSPNPFFSPARSKQSEANTDVPLPSRLQTQEHGQHQVRDSATRSAEEQNHSSSRKSPPSAVLLNTPLKRHLAKHIELKEDFYREQLKNEESENFYGKIVPEFQQLEVCLRRFKELQKQEEEKKTTPGRRSSSDASCLVGDRCDGDDLTTSTPPPAPSSLPPRRHLLPIDCSIMSRQDAALESATQPQAEQRLGGYTHSYTPPDLHNGHQSALISKWRRVIEDVIVIDASFVGLGTVAGRSASSRSAAAYQENYGEATSLFSPRREIQEEELDEALLALNSCKNDEANNGDGDSTDRITRANWTIPNLVQLFIAGNRSACMTDQLHRRLAAREDYQGLSPFTTPVPSSYIALSQIREMDFSGNTELGDRGVNTLLSAMTIRADQQVFLSLETLRFDMVGLTDQGASMILSAIFCSSSTSGSPRRSTPEAPEPTCLPPFPTLKTLSMGYNEALTMVTLVQILDLAGGGSVFDDKHRQATTLTPATQVFRSRLSSSSSASASSPSSSSSLLLRIGCLDIRGCNFTAKEENLLCEWSIQQERTRRRRNGGQEAHTTPPVHSSPPLKFLHGNHHQTHIGQILW